MKRSELKQIIRNIIEEDFRPRSDEEIVDLAKRVRTMHGVEDETTESDEIRTLLLKILNDPKFDSETVKKQMQEVALEHMKDARQIRTAIRKDDRRAQLEADATEEFESQFPEEESKRYSRKRR